MPHRPVPPSAEDEAMTRPRLKDVKTEALLRSVERGSVTHIVKMGAFERHPRDPHDGAIVLRSVLRLLDSEPTPARPASFDSVPGARVKETLQRILGWMDIVSISIRKINRNDFAMVAAFSAIYQDNLHIILRWLRFYMGEASWAFTWQVQTADIAAPKIVIETLNNMDTVCKSDGFRTTMYTSEEVIDLLLSVWLWQDRDGNATYLTYPPEKFDGNYALDPIIHLFAGFCLDPKSQFLVWEKITALTWKEQNRFMQCALSRMEQWKAPPREEFLPAVPINGLDVLIITMCTLLDIRGIAKAFVKFNIAGNALKLALAHGDIPFLTTAPPPATFASVVGGALLHTKSSSAKGNLQHCIIAQLLDAGFLNVLLDDMFTRHALTPSAPPFPVTREEQHEDRDLNPLNYLAPFCAHRAVCEATCRAISNIPESRVATLEGGWAAQYWVPFANVMQLYEHIWNRLPAKQVVLCDNFEHEASASTSGTETKQCSRCQTAVYCSSDCQQHDWSRWHRKECSINRVHRINLELRSAWESHKTRAFFLHLLQQLVLNHVAGTPLHAHTGVSSDEGWTLTSVQAGGIAADPKHLTECPLVEFDATRVPFTASVQTLEGRYPTPAGFQPKMPNGAPMDFPSAPHARFATLVLEAYSRLLEIQKAGSDYEAPSGFTTLAVCSSSLGPYLVKVYGRFAVEGDAGIIRVTLRNGYLRVTPGDDFVDLC